jgi:hypothetical protein
VVCCRQGTGGPSSLARCPVTPELAEYIEEEVVVDGVHATRRRRVSARKGKKVPGNVRFEAQWARLPMSWLIALRKTKHASTKQLAMEILFAEFRRKYTNGEVVLSAATTGLPRATRAVAIRELVQLGLIEVEQHGREATRVVKLK